ncbi:MAG TPA: hypothetical protein VG184_06275 [Acidimicrobiales bacterium]|nr:hypothetical protein [Acidimicrobiales bacterium]
MAVLAVVVAACGGSGSHKASPPSASPGAPANAPVATVLAIPAVTGVGTTVALAPSALSALSSLGVTPSAYGSAKVSGTAITLPITSGYLEVHGDHIHQPGWIAGSVEHDGSGLTLTKGSTTVTVDNFVVDLATETVYASVGGHAGVPLLLLDVTGATVGVQGGTLVLGGNAAKLTPQAATALNGAFATTAFKPGLLLATIDMAVSGTPDAYTDKVREVPRLSGISTSVALGAPTLDTLARVGVTPGALGSATLTGPSLTLPVTAGTLVVHSDKGYKPGYIDGVVVHDESGLSLTRGKTTVVLSDVTVNLGGSEVYGQLNGQVPPQPLLDLDESGARVSVAHGDVHVDGIGATLSSYAAHVLDTDFATTAFTAGLPVGSIDVVASGR